MVHKRESEERGRRKRRVFFVCSGMTYHTGCGEEGKDNTALFHVPFLKSGTWRLLNSVRMRLWRGSQINMSDDRSAVFVLLSTVRAMNTWSRRLKGQWKVPRDTKSHERGSAVTLIFQIELPASPRALKYYEVYAKKAVGLRHFSVATWSLQPEKNILTVTPQSAKHRKDSGVVLSLILCVQYHAYRRANNTLLGPAQHWGKCLPVVSAALLSTLPGFGRLSYSDGVLGSAYSTTSWLGQEQLTWQNKRV